MHRDREVRENTNTSASSFDSFGGGFPGSIFPSIFGGKDPFDDPFFTRPYGSLFGSNMFSSRNPGNLQQPSGSKEPVIEELNSDDEGVSDEMEQDGGSDAAWRNRNPLVEHPEDQAHDNGKSSNSESDISYSNNHDKVEVKQQKARSVSFQRVTYGGIDGAYYTATTSRRTGDDGVTLEESKQADRTTGQARHRISRGIHNKGHSLMRKLDSDSKVETTQALHNLKEDELEGFEQAWSGNDHRRLHGWNDTFDFPGTAGASSTRRDRLVPWGEFPDPFRAHFVRNEGQSVHNFQGRTSSGRPKKVVRINIE